MIEIKKLTKIALIVDIIIWFLFGVMLVFLPEMLNHEGWTNPIHGRAFGGLMFVACIFSVIMLRKEEWEEIKLLYMFMFCMCISVIIVEAVVLAVFSSTFLVITVSQMIMELIINGAKTSLSIIAFLKQ
jgi:hypothetical protein